MSQIKHTAFGFVFLFIVFVLCLPKSADAADWRKFVSETKLYSALMPGQPEEHIETFRIADNQVLHKSEAYAFIDQRPYKDIIKNYVVKFEQTIGLAIKKEKRIQIVNKELDIYIASYQDKNPTIAERRIFDTGKDIIGEASLFYRKADDSLEGTRVKIHLNSTTKFYQIFSGPEKDMYSKITNQFFNSFKAKRGAVHDIGSINVDWNRVESPLSIFAIKVPELAPPYFEDEASITQETQDRERVGMVFNDPVRQQKLFYSITGYRLDQEMSFALTETALAEDFMKKHGRTLAKIKLRKDFAGDLPFIETAYDIRPPKRYPYADKVRLRGIFLGNYLMVQELIGPKL